jgi:hypothetical protein
MNTIFRIIMILVVAAVVAGAFSLAVNNSSSASSTNGPAMINGQSFQLTERPGGGDRDGGSGAGGLEGILGTVMKLTGIAIVVLLLQKGYSLLGNRRLISTH